MEPIETIEVREKQVACDGDGGALGHPRVFLNMGGDDHVDCPYCGRRFILQPDALAAAADD